MNTLKRISAILTIVGAIFLLPVIVYAGSKVNVTLVGNGKGVVDDEMFEWEVGTSIPKTTVDTYNQHPKEEYAGQYRLTGWYKDSACTTPWIFTEEGTDSHPADVVENYMSLYAGWEKTPPVPSAVSDITVYTAFNESDIGPFNLAQNEYFADSHIHIELAWDIDKTKANDRENYNTALTDIAYEYQWLSLDAENNESSLTTTEPCDGDETRLDINDISEMQTMKLFCRLTCKDLSDDSCSISMDSPVFTVHFLGEDGHACYFDAGDGTGEMSYVLCKEDSDGQIFLPESSFEAAVGTDDEFLGWNVVGGPSERVKPGQKFTADFSLISARAVYDIPEYTVTYHLNGHDDVIIDDARKGTALDSVGTPTIGWYSYLLTREDDYAFAGWYKEAACTNAWDMRTEISGNTELFAKWVPYPALAEDLVFNGEEQALADDSGCVAGFFEYALHEMSGNERTPENIYSLAADDTTSLTVPVALYSGNYLLCCKPRTESSNNYKPLGIVTIDSKPIIEVIDNKTKQEGESDPQFTYSYIGKIEGFEERIGTISEDPERKGSYVLRREEGEDPGAYEIDWVYDPLPNVHEYEHMPTWPQLPLYTVSEVRKGTLTITDRPDLKVGLTITGKTGAEKPFDIKLTRNSKTDILSFGELANTTNLSVTPTQKHYYVSGQQVTLAISNLDTEHIRFDGWYSDSVCLSTDSTYTFTPEGDEVIIASFTGGAETSNDKFYYMYYDQNGGYGYQGETPENDSELSYEKVYITYDWWGVKQDTYAVLPICKILPPKEMTFDKWEIGGKQYKAGDSVPINSVITAKAIWKPLVSKVEGIKETYEYTGKAIKPEPKVYYGDNLLKKDTDYTVTYKNNTNVGTATVTITGKGRYKTSSDVTFEITPQHIGTIHFVAKNIYTKFNERAQNPKVILTKDGKKLKKNKDFSIEWENENGEMNKGCVWPGTYHVKITGIGNYTGEREVLFVLLMPNEKAMEEAKIKVEDQKYTGAPIKPKFTVKIGKTTLKAEDYTVIWPYDCTSVGTKTVRLIGKGKYLGNTKFTYRITGIPMKSVIISNLDDCVFNGYYQHPAGVSQSYTQGTDPEEVVILAYKTSKNAAPKILKKNEDYTITYSNNRDAGKASITFTGIGKFEGTVTKTFKIKPYDLSNASINPELHSLNGIWYDEEDKAGSLLISVDRSINSKAGVKPKVSILCLMEPVVNQTIGTYNKRVLQQDKDYTVSYANNKTSYISTETAYAKIKKKPTATITFKGNYKSKKPIIVNFDIAKQDLANTQILVNDVREGSWKSAPSILDNGATLKAGADYDLVYKYVNPTIVTQTVKKNEKIITRAAGDIVDKQDNVPIDTEIEVIATGKNDYYGEKTGHYKIISAAKDISKATVTIKSQVLYEENAYLTKDDITVVISKVTLSKDEYEIVSLSKNKSIGTATVTIRGKGNYGGLKTVKFTILPANLFITE